MCGPSGEQEALAAQEQSFSNMLMSNYTQNFGAQSQVLQNLNNIFTPIAEAGPDQQGFGPQELAALRTQAGEGTAAEYAKAQRALNTELAVRGGGNQVLPGGAADTLKSQIAAAAAAQQASQNLAITESNYALGRQKWQQATGGLQALAGEYNPNALAGEFTQANQGAFGEATKVQEMKNQATADIVGGITSLGLDAATFGAGAALGFGGTSGIAGGLNALAGTGKL